MDDIRIARGSAIFFAVFWTLLFAFDLLSGSAAVPR